MGGVNNVVNYFIIHKSFFLRFLGKIKQVFDVAFGTCHRAVCKANIIDNNGRVFLIDFNASRKLNNATKDTVVMGTVGYASPEQLGVAQSDPRTDIYALGVLLNVMLCGKHPCEQLVKGKAGRIVNKCTNINPDQRYQTVDSLIKAL